MRHLFSFLLTTRAQRAITFFLILFSCKVLHAGQGQLILFTADDGHPVSKDFTAKFLPGIRQLAEAQGIEFRLLDAAKGAPEWIAGTPAIVFQNHLGRSLYIGRYQHIDKVKTFIRTVKRLPQVQLDNEKHEVFVHQAGRATLVTPVKITDLGGVLPKKFEAASFRKAALAAIGKGMSKFSFHALFNAKRNHRLIYTAFYPYRSEDGKFFLSVEMYSQFNCISPVFKRFENPFSGTWKNWQAVFTAAGAEMERQVFALLNSIEHGDGFLPLPGTTPLKSFEELGLPLPAVEPGQVLATAPVNLKLPQAWVVAGPVEESLPMVGFGFPAPVDNYSGELTTLNGNLQLNQDLDIAKAIGTFSVDMASLTMGDPDLDHSVAGMLKMIQHPQSSFTFKEISVLENARLAFGTLTQFIVAGEFSFMGILAPVSVTTQMEPVLDEQGMARLQVNAAFSIRLKEKYGVKGPDGPDPAKDTVVFELNFLLAPAA